MNNLETVHDLPKFKEGTVVTSTKTGPVWVHRVYLGTGPQVKEDINLVEKETVELAVNCLLLDFNLTKTSGSWEGVPEHGLILEVITGNRHGSTVDIDLWHFIKAYKHRFQQDTLYITHYRVDSEVF